MTEREKNEILEAIEQSSIKTNALPAIDASATYKVMVTSQQGEVCTIPKDTFQSKTQGDAQGQTIAQHTSRIAAAEGGVAALQVRALALENRATAVEGRATALEGRAEALEGDVSDGGERISALEERTEFLPSPAGLSYAMNIAANFTASLPSNGSCYMKYREDLRLEFFPQVDMSGVRNMGGMFAKCSNLRYIDTTGWDLTGVTSISDAFADIGDVDTLDLEDKLGAGSTKHMYATFNSWSIHRGPRRVLAANDIKVTELRYLCRGSARTVEYDFSRWDVSEATSFGDVWWACQGLETLKISGWDFRKGANFTYTLHDVRKLTHIVGPVSNIMISLAVITSPLLTRESMLVLINGLYDYVTNPLEVDVPEVPQVLSFHATAKARLTEEDIAIATNKGWTIA